MQNHTYQTHIKHVKLFSQASLKFRAVVTMQDGRQSRDWPWMLTRPGQTPPQTRIALAAAAALDLAADLARRSNILIAVAPKLRSKPAAKIVDLMPSPRIASRPPKPPATRR